LCGAWVSALLVLLATSAPPEAAAQGPARPLLGRPLEEVLGELQAEGLPIVFSSATVPADAVVLAEPSSREPRRLLEEILAPHGLAVRATRGGRLVVVRAEPQIPRHVLSGVVTNASDGAPMPGVHVRVVGEEEVAVTDRTGRFALETTSSHTVLLQLEATGFRTLLRQAAVAEVMPLRLLLEPLPVERELIEVSSTTVASPASPVTGSSFGPLELERRAELAGDPLRAAGQSPGVSTQHSARPIVRGGEAGSVGIEIDGLELYEPYHLRDFGSLLSIVPTGVLAELDLDTGGVDASRGDRLGGALEMTTLSPDWRLRGAAEVGPVLAGAHASGEPESGRLRWIGSARVGLLDATARALRADDDPSYWDALGKIALDVAAGHEIRLQALASGDELSTEKERDEERSGTFEQYATRYRSRYLWVSHMGVLSERAWVEQRIAASEVDAFRSAGTVLDDRRFAVDDDRRLHGFDLRHDGYASLGSRHELHWGAEARQIEVDLGYRTSLAIADPVAAVRTNPARIDATRTGSLDGRQEAVYLQDRWRWSKLTFLAGLRWEGGSLWRQSFLHPRAQVGFEATARDRFTAAWGRYSQSQRPYEVSFEDGETMPQLVERAEEVVLGWERSLWQRRHVRLRAELFDRAVAHPRARFVNLFDPVSLFPETESDRVRLAADRVRAQGAALAVDGRFGRRFEAGASLSTTSVREGYAGDEAVGAGDEPWDGRVRLTWDSGRKWSVRAAFRRHAGPPITGLVLGTDPDTGAAVPVLGPLRGERLGALQSLDVEAVRSWRVGQRRLELVLVVENATNASNPRGFEYSVTGEGAAAAIEREPLFWPGRVPGFRLRFEF
jgi:hypothetical protein